MPLEVRQIGIHMAVGDAGEGAGESGSGADSSPLGLPDGGGDADEQRAKLIEQCVEAVLAELARRADR
jgi:uncharacterized protein DUF5908